MPAIGSREWLTRIAFEELEGRTKLTHSILHPTTEARYGHLQAGMKAGTVQTLNRLAKKVALKAEACVTNA